MKDQAPSPGDLKARLVGRAMSDEPFRRQLLASPKATIERELNVTLPADLEVTVVEETPSRLCLVPPARRLAAGELADQDLAAVAGGGVVIEHLGPGMSTPTYGLARLEGYFRQR